MGHTVVDVFGNMIYRDALFPGHNNSYPVPLKKYTQLLCWSPQILFHDGIHLGVQGFIF